MELHPLTNLKASNAKYRVVANDSDTRAMIIASPGCCCDDPEVPDTIPVLSIHNVPEQDFEAGVLFIGTGPLGRNMVHDGFVKYKGRWWYIDMFDADEMYQQHKQFNLDALFKTLI